MQKFEKHWFKRFDDIYVKETSEPLTDSWTSLGLGSIYGILERCFIWITS